MSLEDVFDEPVSFDKNFIGWDCCCYKSAWSKLRGMLWLKRHGNRLLDNLGHELIHDLAKLIK
jgi:hypothetical protein